jgi:putative restriction endonuclease
MDYLHRFAHLHTATSRVHWTAATTYRAPNKPLLLLAVLDLCAQGSLTSNLVTLTPELGELFAGYWGRVMPADRHGNLAMPFFHLRHDGFWHLVPAPGQETALAALTTATSASQLRTLLLGARLDDELYDLMRVDTARDQLRTVLIQTYFTPARHAPLLEQGLTNLAAFRYSQELLVSAHTQPLRETADIADRYQATVRNQGFRRVVVTAYDHRCALCGIRLLTDDGHTAVDAAHIIPWSRSHNDDPRNGMALCRLCHWTFDEGLIGVSARYAVLLAPRLAQTPNVPGHLTALDGRRLLGPAEDNLWPDHDALAWHRREVLRS